MYRSEKCKSRKRHIQPISFILKEESRTSKQSMINRISLISKFSPTENTSYVNLVGEYIYSSDSSGIAKNHVVKYFLCYLRYST